MYVILTLLITHIDKQYSHVALGLSKLRSQCQIKTKKWLIWVWVANKIKQRQPPMGPGQDHLQLQYGHLARLSRRGKHWRWFMVLHWDFSISLNDKWNGPKVCFFSALCTPIPMWWSHVIKLWTSLCLLSSFELQPTVVDIHPLSLQQLCGRREKQHNTTLHNLISFSQLSLTWKQNPNSPNSPMGRGTQVSQVTTCKALLECKLLVQIHLSVAVLPQHCLRAQTLTLRRMEWSWGREFTLNASYWQPMVLRDVVHQWFQKWRRAQCMGIISIQ